MTMFKTPYNFVPLSPFVLYPEWAPLASHDHPFADGLSGELALGLKATTPLSMGGTQDSASENSAGKIHFYRTPEGIPAIPGSALKGALRNVLSIATFGRMSQVEDRKLSIRDISQPGTYYRSQIVEIKARAGWLRFYKGQWQVQPCNYTRLHQKDLIRFFGLNEGQWKSEKTAKARYGLLDGLRKINFDTEPHKNKAEGIASNFGYGSTSGTVVVTGQPGVAFDGGRSAKKWEFIFFDVKADDWQPVPEQALRDFLFVHENSEEWSFFQKSGHRHEVIPVFWHGTQVTRMTSMGLAQMYRLAQKNSLHDALRNTSTHHLGDTRVDFSELLFGRLKPEQPGPHDWGLRGRVNVGIMKPKDEVGFHWTEDTVLSSPKPVFYPAYLKQDEDASDPALTLDSGAPELRGWKRYPVKPEFIQSPPADVSNKVKVRLEAADAGTEFTGRLRFHNLRPVELGALLWVLDFGGREHLRHALGTGKPYGLGQTQIQLETEHCSIIPNDRNSLDGLSVEQILTASRKVFTDYMDSVWTSVAENSSKGWVLSPQVNHLLSMADPGRGARCADLLTYLETPKDFGLVKNNEVLALYGDQPEEVSWHINLKKALPSYDGVIDIAMALAQAEAERKLQLEKLRMERERATMKPGDAVLSKIVEKIEGDALGQTLQSDIEKLIRSILSMAEGELPELENADSVLASVELHNKKRLNKACKKVRVFLNKEG